MLSAVLVRRKVVPVGASIGAGVVIGVLQLMWYYVANSAVLEQSPREMWKTVFLAAGIAVLVLFAASVALSSRDHWVRRLTGAVVLMMGVAWVGTLAALYFSRGRLSGNPVLIGEPLAVRILGGALALVVYIAIGLGPALLVGFAARLTRFGRSPNNSS